MRLGGVAGRALVATLGTGVPALCRVSFDAEGYDLAPETLKLLTDGGLSLSLDIYGPVRDDEPSTPPAGVVS